MYFKDLPCTLTIKIGISLCRRVGRSRQQMCLHSGSISPICIPSFKGIFVFLLPTGSLCHCRCPTDVEWVKLQFEPVHAVASVVSNPLRPHGLKLAKLLCPWDFTGKIPRVGCHFLLQGIFLTQGSNLCLLRLLHCRWILYQWTNRKATDTKFEPIDTN